MLAQLLKTHVEKQKHRNDETEALRRAAIASVGKLTGQSLEEINEGVAKVFENQRVIDREVKALSALSLRYSKQAKDWVQLMDKFNGALKDLGDVENWAQTIEKDIAAVSQFLEEEEQSGRTASQQEIAPAHESIVS